MAFDETALPILAKGKNTTAVKNKAGSMKISRRNPCSPFFCMEIDSSRECECGHGIDDVQHFFLECDHYSHIRKEMIKDITTTWQGSENEGSLSLTVSFLLAPFNNQKLTSQEVQEILLAVFRFIRRSSRCL